MEGRGGGNVSWEREEEGGGCKYGEICCRERGVILIRENITIN